LGHWACKDYGRVENRVRITPQLIGTISGAHLWAERYDRESEANFRQPRPFWVRGVSRIRA
jgi:hypothetical protein